MGVSHFLLIALSACVQALPVEDLVDNEALKKTFNGVDVGLPSRTWSGYLEVNSDKYLHYMFVESLTAATDPVLIWFNGGPGCSSLLGMFQENGPLLVDADGDREFANNTYPWNNRTNVLYLEQPSGVGFSIAGSAWALNHSDYSQSQDTFVALQKWYEKFPEYQNNSLFISGESYGGIYVPYLSWQVYEHNLKVKVWNDNQAKNSSWTNMTTMPLKGFLVGNGVTNWAYDTNPSLPQTLSGFDMITNDVLDSWDEYACNADQDDVVTGDDQLLCEKLWNVIGESIPEELNPYDLYRTIPDEEQETMEGVDPLKRPGLTLAKTAPWLKGRKNSHRVFAKTANLTRWLNQNDTKEVLHVNATNQSWVDCNDPMFDTWQYLPEASQWIYTVLKTSGYIRMMHYSGDTDGVVPTYGTKRWIEDLGWPKTSNYTMWKTKNQVSGFYQKFEGLDFVTVKGVGHMAPQWARQPMLELITKWIHQEDMFKE